MGAFHLRMGSDERVHMKKVALITGAGRGIGLEIARRLAGENFDLAVCDIHAQKTVQDALDGLREAGADVLYCLSDVSIPGDRQRMLAEVKARFRALERAG